MGLLDQLDLDAVKASFTADLPTPVDVLNLIHFKDEDAYKWYGLMALPLLKLVGAEVGWMGKHVSSVLGDSRAEELLVVRYPNQRRFFALALNPYYVLVANPQRMKAVKQFEASFTHSPDDFSALRESKLVLSVHSHDLAAPLDALLKDLGGTRVYRSVESSVITIAKRYHPANTNPLEFKHTTLYRFESEEECVAALSPSVLNQAREVLGEPSLQLYRRVPRRDAMPSALTRFLGAM